MAVTLRREPLSSCVVVICERLLKAAPFLSGSSNTTARKEKLTRYAAQFTPLSTPCSSLSPANARRSEARLKQEVAVFTYSRRGKASLFPLRFGKEEVSEEAVKHTDDRFPV